MLPLIHIHTCTRARARGRVDIKVRDFRVASVSSRPSLLNKLSQCSAISSQSKLTAELFLRFVVAHPLNVISTCDLHTRLRLGHLRTRVGDSLRWREELVKTLKLCRLMWILLVAGVAVETFRLSPPPQWPSGKAPAS